MKAFSFFIATWALAIFGLPPTAHAATYRVDDSASIPQLGSATMKWSHPVPGRSAANSLVIGTAEVQVRLNLGPWQQRVGRVYMVLPEQTGVPVTVHWTTQGRLLPGQLAPGQRALVYAGPILSALLDEKLSLRFEIDTSKPSSARRLNFHFEIDVD